ncbi:insulin-like growth factor-binding protein 3 [Electrophorus electricus]|uniref:Insulin-like growth factor-binding protein 3 n=2 Tax=Electrophorus TaxID=8004 RepID=A0AAY5F630_ELEEL|nr:insulin-like growth factor-binding protein 3 [Electrophorus electricus]
MVATLCSLSITVILASIARLSQSVGTVIRCEPCGAGAQMLCKPVPKDCAERVREPGCGCCLTCALLRGQPCGIYTGKCGVGLTCQPQPGEMKPLQALLEGRGICVNSTLKKSERTSPLVTTQEVNSAGIPEEQLTSNTSLSVPAEIEQLTVQLSPHGRHHDTPYPNHPKAEMIRREQVRQNQNFKLEDLPGVPPSEQQNFSFESKQESEYGPCRREMEGIMNSMKIADILDPHGFRIPNCDKKGFYKKKQCRPSKGRKRGMCWCVDKYGQPLPGFHGKERGSAHCFAIENQ